MKKFLTLLCVLTFIFGFSVTAGAAVIYFDDITTLDTYSIPVNYEGFTWSSWAVVSDSAYASLYYNTYNSPSGEYAAGNAGGYISVSLSSIDDFDFTGAYFSSYSGYDSELWYSSTSITIEGYNDGSFIDSVTISLSFNKYDWVDVNLLGVDELVFLSSSSSETDYKWWLMDNFTYNKAPVPEPATMLLLGLGLAGLASVSRRKFKK